MAKICTICKKEYKTYIKINGKPRNLNNRTKCLDCLPFGQSIYRKKTAEEKRAAGNKKARNWYNKKKKELGKDPIRILREKRKRKLVETCGGKCQFCGYDKTDRNITFHHLRNKKFTISSRELQFSLQKVIEEIRKCAMACHNCHGEIHEGLIVESVVIQANKDLKNSFLSIKEKDSWASLGCGKGCLNE